MPDRIEAFIASLGIAPDARVLEIGCGHGVAATLICGRLTTGRYTAIDRSETMIHAAARRNQAFVERGIAEFIVVDIETADLGARRFDVALAMRVRLFHAERARATALVRQWLAPDGRLFVQYDAPDASNRIPSRGAAAARARRRRRP
jgi:ubiquinone/menaquinone biosynthesis C-methylase UbiE